MGHRDVVIEADDHVIVFVIDKAMVKKGREAVSGQGGFFLMKRALTIVNALGLMLVVFSLTYFIPIITAIIYADQSVLLDFMLAMAWTASLGVLMWLLTRRYKGELSIRHGYLLVVGMWTMMPAFATIPLLLVLPGLSFTDAYFETMSGLTTTGATVLVGLDNLPPAINIWRHELNWLGGLGIIVLAVAILPLLGIGGRQLFKAETPGPMKEAALTPRIADTARNLWVVYLAITATCILALKWAGMDRLDAVCHSFSAMGLGGFSTHDASITRPSRAPGSQRANQPRPPRARRPDFLGSGGSLKT